MKAKFPNDRISRVDKGVNGADIHHAFMQNGKASAMLVLNSKNRKAWQWDFVTKLRADQMAAKADYAILSTWKLPKDKHEVMEHNGVLIAKPAHVPFLVDMLRRHSFQIAALRAAGKNASSMQAKLIGLVTSDPFQQKLKSLGTIAAKAEDLDDKEKTQHAKVWKERGKLNAQLKAVSTPSPPTSTTSLATTTRNSRRAASDTGNKKDAPPGLPRRRFFVRRLHARGQQRSGTTSARVSFQLSAITLCSVIAPSPQMTRSFSADRGANKPSRPVHFRLKWGRLPEESPNSALVSDICCACRCRS